METGIFLQARTRSSRFPGKVLEKIDNTDNYLTKIIYLQGVKF